MTALATRTNHNMQNTRLTTAGAHLTAVLYLGVYVVGVLSLLVWAVLLAQPFGISLSASDHRMIVTSAPQAVFAEGTRVALAHPEGIAHQVRTAVITAQSRADGTLQYTLGSGEAVASRSVLGAVLMTLPLLGLIVSALSSLAGVLALIGAPFVLFGATQFFARRVQSGHTTGEVPLLRALQTLHARYRQVRARRQAKAIAAASEARKEYAYEPATTEYVAATHEQDMAHEPNYTSPHEMYGAVVKLARRTHRHIHPHVSF